MRKIVIAITMLLLTVASCKKNKTEEQLPPETHEGKFTFGCKVDGKIYTASGKGGGVIGFDHVSYILGSSDSSINIFAGTTSDTKNKFSVDFTVKYNIGIGTYIMKTYPYQGTFIDESNGNLPGLSNTYITTDNYLGKIEIKYFDGAYSPYNKGTILSGTFEMEGINGNGNVIHITEGRFDIGQ
jgi:hypothetical protein